MFLSACGFGYTDVVEALLINGSGMEEALLATDSHGNNALHLAIDGNHVEVTQILLEEGVDVNQKNEDGICPIHLAVEEGKDEVLRLLLNRIDLDPNSKDNDGHTAIQIASDKDGNLVDLLLARADVDVNATNDSGWTSLHFATNNGDDGIVRRLLAHKDTDSNLMNDVGWAPLHFATLSAVPSVVGL